MCDRETGFTAAMKILVVSNLYPPHHVGGYELGCRDVVQALRARGHRVHVLTSAFRLEGKSDGPEADVTRELHWVASAADRRHEKLHECRLLSRAIRQHQPDIVYFWNQAGLSFWLPIAARWLGRRIAYFLSDTNFVSWRVGAFLTGWARGADQTLRARIIRSVLGETFLVHGYPIIRNQTCHFASRFLRSCADRGGIPIAEETSVVAHWGVDVRQFSVEREVRWPWHRLLYAGQLARAKGVHTAIAAIALLSKEAHFANLHLSIAGGGLHPEYEKELREQVLQAGLGERVRFLGKLSRHELAKVYAEHDILVFPSEWDEPFAITPLEAAAAGLAIVATNTGGSGERFREGETAKVFGAGDAQDCARALRELLADRALAEAMRQRARQEIVAHHTLDAMVHEIETSLRRVARQKSDIS